MRVEVAKQEEAEAREDEEAGEKAALEHMRVEVANQEKANNELEEVRDATEVLYWCVSGDLKTHYEKTKFAQEASNALGVELQIVKEISSLLASSTLQLAVKLKADDVDVARKRLHEINYKIGELSCVDPKAELADAEPQ